jgi:hypothetical protein
MRNADYAPTDTPKSIRLINCLKSNRFYRSSGARNAPNRSSASVLPTGTCVAKVETSGVGEVLTGDGATHFAIEQNVAAEAQAAGGMNPFGQEVDGEFRYADMSDCRQFRVAALPAPALAPVD